MPQFRFKLFAVIIAVLCISSMTMVTFAQDEQIELQITWWGSQARHDRTIAVIEQYEAANPHVKIVYEFANFNDYWTKLTTQAAGGQLACVMQQDYAYLAEWANRGLLTPLDDFIASGVIDTTNITDALLDGGRVNGEVYGISLGTNSQAIIIDADAFEAAGLELPATDWTWADFEEIALKLHDELGIWATYLGRNSGLADIQMWKSLYLGHGMQPFSEDQTALGYEDDQPLIDYFNMVLRLQEAGALASLEDSAAFEDSGPELSPIVTGDSALQYQWSNQVVAIYNAAGEDRNLELWTLPRPVGGQPENYFKPSMYFSVTSQCPHPEEAAAFINFFTNDLEANEVLLAERGVPISSAVREHLLPLLDTGTAQTFAFLEMLGDDVSPIFPPDPPGFGDFRSNVYIPLFIEPVLYGQMSIEDGVKILRDEAALILAQNVEK